MMKHPVYLSVMMAGVLLAGCVSSSTFDKKSAELAACETRAKNELAACNTARTEAETRLTAATQELEVSRKAAEANQQKLDAVQQQENQLRERIQKELEGKNIEIGQRAGQITVRMPDQIMFRPGDAELAPEGTAMLDKLMSAISDSTSTIRVEGHTDDTPISAKLKKKYPSNWELSAAHASAVARYIETKHHINPKRLESLGLSMYHPVVSNDTVENKQRNRRVEIVLIPAAAAEAVPTPALQDTPGKTQSP